jgi:deoxycytidylate deaminase
LLAVNEFRRPQVTGQNCLPAGAALHAMGFADGAHSCQAGRHMKARQRKSWEETALILAETIADCRSQDPYLQVGACAVLTDDSVCLGYNGPPPKVEIDWSDRERRGARIIHAEVNALRAVKPGQCKFLAVTHLPCRHCMTFIASKGIRRIVFRQIYERDTLAFELAQEFGIQLVQIPGGQPA